MSWLIPCLILSLLAYGYLSGADVYSAFVRGAAEALPAMLKILPCMAAMMIGLSVFRGSGMMDRLTALLAPALGAVGVPGELAPLILLRPFSGGAAMALLQDVYAAFGPDTYLGLAASIMLGSTETIFYTVSLYLGSIGVTKPRYAVPAALISSLAGTAAALVLAGKLVYNIS